MAGTDQRRSRHHDESPTKPNKKKKKASHNPEKNLLVNLHSCSKSKDLSAALALYDGAITSTDIRLSQQHFQTLLYLCSASISDPSLQTLAIDRGFQIFDRMVSSRISPNESSVTAVARLAAAKCGGDYAFKLVKDIVTVGGVSVPCLRTYSPALLCFCASLEAEKGYEVEDHMDASGIVLEEAEIAQKGSVSPAGKCLSCGEHLACVDTNELETENFVDSLVALAMERKAKMNSCEPMVDFSEFRVRKK